MSRGHPLERLVRFTVQGSIRLGLLEGAFIRPFTGVSLDALGPPGKPLPLHAAELLLPVDPHQVLGIGRNHPGVAPERPDRPAFFSKSRSALCGSSDKIVLPAFATAVIAEAELAVVVARRLSKASPEQAASAFAGILLANDITALPIDPWHLFESKAADTFAPVGRSILRGLDVDDVNMVLEVNGHVTAQGSTRDLFLRPAEVVSALSQIITLMPDDIVFTGAVAVSAPLKSGDTVAIAIAGVERVENLIM